MQADDIYKFISTLNINNPIVIGHSGGATCAMYLAIKYNELISKLVLCSALARKDNVSFSKLSKFLSKILIYPSKKKTMKLWDLVESAKDIPIKDLEQIKCKTLIVNGSKDIVNIEEAKYLKNAISNSNLLILKNENHTSYLRKIKWYNELKEFLGE